MSDIIIITVISGYQRQLTYANPDGSYNDFIPEEGSTGSGSLFLTALTLQSFAKAAQYIHVDAAQQKKSLDFIVKNQDSWGCFTPVSI